MREADAARLGVDSLSALARLPAAEAAAPGLEQRLAALLWSGGAA